MKSLFLILTLVNVALAGDMSQHDAMMNNQVSVTHDIVQQVLTELKNRPLPQETYSHPDFLAAANRFDALAERALLNFESMLREEIMPQTRPYLTRLESITNSTIYSNDQKEILLFQQRQEAVKYFADLESKYMAEIYKLLTVDFPAVNAKLVGKCYNRILWHFTPDEYYYLVNVRTPRTENFKSVVPSTTIEEGSEAYCGYHDEGETHEVSVAHPLLRWIPEIKDVIYQKVIRSQCTTSSCALLLADHIKKYISSVGKNINVKLSFPFDLNLYPIAMSKQSTSNLGNYIHPWAKDTAGLPFDITPAEFEKTKAE